MSAPRPPSTPRPPHRNLPGKPYPKAPPDPDATYRVHDGSTEKVTLVLDGLPMTGLAHNDAMKAKSAAASRYKKRRATVELEEHGAGDDPELAELAAKATAAAAPAAAAAQARHEAVKAKAQSQQPTTAPALATDDTLGEEDELGDLSALDGLEDAGGMPTDEEIASANADAREAAGMALWVSVNFDDDRTFAEGEIEKLWAAVSPSQREECCRQAADPGAHDLSSE